MNNPPLQAVHATSWRDYLALCKPRVVSLIVFTALIGMLLASPTLVPLDRLLVETDCPYLAPQPVRGKRNEPAYVAHTATLLAQLKGVSVSEIEKATTQNARTLLGLAGV